MSRSFFYRAACSAFASIALAGAAQAAPTPWWSPYATDANTLGLWHFDDVTASTGPFADSSGHGNNGALNSSVNNVAGQTLTTPVASAAGTGPGAGQFGTALNFAPNFAFPPDGVQETNKPFAWGKVQDNAGQLNYTTAVTVEAWVRPSAHDLTHESYIVGKEVGASEWNFGFLNDGTLFIDTIDATNNGYHYVQTPTNLFTADTWAHVAAVVTYGGGNSTFALYVNGAPQGSVSWADTTGLDQNAAVLNFGNRGNQDHKYVTFRGQIDEVRISDVAREFSPIVPEPTSVALLGAGALLLNRRRRVSA